MVIAIIRIAGQVGLNKHINETLYRLKLRKKLVCILVDEKDEIKIGMVEKVKDYVTYGTIDEKLVKQLEEKRGKDSKKGFFRLHPPIGGFKKSTNLSAESGRGVLGKNKNIAKLLERML